MERHANVTIDYGMVNGKKLTKKFSRQQLHYLEAVLGYPLTVEIIREHTREWAESLACDFPECEANRFGRARGKREQADRLDDEEE